MVITKWLRMEPEGEGEGCGGVVEQRAAAIESR